VGAHRRCRAGGLAGDDACEDFFVLGDGQLKPPRREDKPARAVKVGAGRFDHALDAREAHVPEDDVVELEVPFVEALLVLDLGRGALVAHVPLQRVDELGAVLAGDDPDGLRLERLADQHVFEHVGNTDERNDRAALGEDVDEPLGLQPRQGLGDRETRHAEPLADGPFVDCLTGLERQGDDGLAERVGHVNGDVAAAGRGRRAQKFVGTFRCPHANMLVAELLYDNRLRVVPVPPARGERARGRNPRNPHQKRA
jgi:hypothetical protein